MEIITEAQSFEYVKFCFVNKVPNVILGNNQFATRISYSFSLEQLSTLCTIKGNTKIWVKMNAFFFEHDLIEVKQYLQALAKLDIDYVIFQDYAIAEINHNLDLQLKLHYNPETLVTNYGQFPFYIENHFTGCFLARELMPNEIEEIVKNKLTLLTEVQGFGFGLVMHSRWNLLSNFKDVHEKQNINTNEFVSIKEKLRKIPNYIFEDSHGSHMMTGYIIETLSKIKWLNAIGVDLLQLNFLNIKYDAACQITMIYLQATKNWEHTDSDLKLWEEQINGLKLPFPLSLGFIGGTAGVLHLQKEDDYEA